MMDIEMVEDGYIETHDSDDVVNAKKANARMAFYRDWDKMVYPLLCKVSEKWEHNSRDILFKVFQKLGSAESPEAMVELFVEMKSEVDKEDYSGEVKDEEEEAEKTMDQILGVDAEEPKEESEDKDNSDEDKDNY